MMDIEKKPVVMTVAGFDPGSGAGISADIKTMNTLGVYGIGLLTSITSQNHNSFSSVTGVEPEVFSDQLESICKGYKIDCIKSGLMTNEAAEILGSWKRDNPDIFMICDPVFTATSGKNFLKKDDAVFLEKNLYKFAGLITPNIHEASILSGIEITTAEDMVKAGRILTDRIGNAVLIKGGHLEGDAIDILFSGGCEKYFSTGRIEGVNSHGSGCVLSSAIAAYKGHGEELESAVSKAKNFLTGLLQNPSVLEGIGPVIDPSIFMEGI